jgi:hypothetical protein
MGGLCVRAGSIEADNIGQKDIGVIGRILDLIS